MIKIIVVGKLKENYLKDALKEYMKRLSKYSKINLIEVSDSDIDEEALSIIKNINDKDYVITLDIKGKELSSLELASKLDEWLINNSNLCFIVGGSDGLGSLIKDRSNYSISFSKLTFPHQLFRIMLLEQLYRAFKINHNETYHK